MGVRFDREGNYPLLQRIKERPEDARLRFVYLETQMLHAFQCDLSVNGGSFEALTIEGNKKTSNVLILQKIKRIHGKTWFDSSCLLEAFLNGCDNRLVMLRH